MICYAVEADGYTWSSLQNEKYEISYKECFRILNWKESEQCDKVKERCYLQIQVQQPKQYIVYHVLCSFIFECTWSLLALTTISCGRYYLSLFYRWLNQDSE